MAQTPNGGREDAQEALEAAHKAQEAWAAQSAAARGAYLKQMATLVRKHRTDLARLLAEEQAKTLPLAYAEIDGTAEYFDYYAGWARLYEGEIIQSDRQRENIPALPPAHRRGGGHLPLELPFFVMARKVAPSPTYRLHRRHQAQQRRARDRHGIRQNGGGSGPPPPACSTSSPAAAPPWRGRSSPLVDMVTLTGSVEAGQRIITASAANVTKKFSLELGGKAPVIVCANADLDLAVRGVTASRTIFSGQVCNCAERLYVQDSIAEQFADKLAEAFAKVRLGNPFDEPAPDMCSQINAEQLEKNRQHGQTRQGRRRGSHTGGAPPNRETGYFYAPTLLGNCRQDMEIVRKVFGPVLPHAHLPYPG